MDLAELQEFGILQAGDQAQHACLFAVAKMVLKPDHPKSVGHQIFLPKLHAGVRLFAGLRVAKPFWLHRAETQGFGAAAGDLLDRQAALEPLRFLETFHGNRFGGEQLGDERFILLAAHRAVYVIVAALVVTRRFEGDAHIDAVGRNYRRDRIVKIKLIVAGKLHYLAGKRVRGQRPRGDYRYLIGGNCGDFFADDLDIRVGLDTFGDELRELDAVNRKRRTGGHARRRGGLHHQRTAAPQLFL